eukprot:scaffold8085_cov26-Cyclotella_meneghiniana.AAC.1
MMFKRDAVAMWIAGITSVGGRRGLLVEASEVGDASISCNLSIHNSSMLASSCHSYNECRAKLLISKQLFAAAL